MGKQWKQCQTLFWGAPKSLQMVIAAMKLKDAYSLEEKEKEEGELGMGTESHHFMGNRWGNSGNSVRLYIWGLQNHCRW